LICCWKAWKEVFKIGWVVCIWRLVSSTLLLVGPLEKETSHQFGNFSKILA
jgi:hypothetical protein